MIADGAKAYFDNPPGGTMRRNILTAFALTALFTVQANADPIGEWRVADGTATVRISKCSAALCGFVASTRSAPGKDVRNPDASKRSRSVIGIEVLINLRPAGDNVWTGTTYNAEDGLLYNATVSQAGAQSLQIKGCGANGGVCGSETWTRVK
jgi:uncharacterized protein (DUF2147 family)